ncbi:MAG TPA: sigma factor-like helix-turn-helix DNA-binding protein [Gaiellales bacterium]|jgi:DNA-directed RNA polymerase specialized sigma24 family protein|nr:sigma factor-like helix-turn-helix DNA-binding protein [Gaiellales bacterium]
MTHTHTQAESAEARFAEVFQNLGSIVRYAAARGSRDPEGIAAEVMTIAWRRLPSLPADDPRPWLFVTARNLLMAERRRTGRQAPLDERHTETPAPEAHSGDPAVTAALMQLRPADRDALLLVSWDDLTAAQAARVAGISPVAFRVRLYRARRRFEQALSTQQGDVNGSRTVGMEST